MPREVAKSALAHTLGGVEAAYNRAAMVERRGPVMQRRADYCDGKDATASDEAKVVRIAGRR
jgi:hypothetical protein